MTGGSASRSAGILSRANELERLTAQRQGLEESLAQAARELEEANRKRRPPPMRWRPLRPSCVSGKMLS